MKICHFLMARGPIVRRAAYQLLDAGMSVGSNTEEALGAQSHADFAARCGIVRKEARESRFWLRLVAAYDPAVATHVGPHATEAGELVAIFSAMIRTARSLSVSISVAISVTFP
jgi:four helix bundle protein